MFNTEVIFQGERFHLILEVLRQEIHKKGYIVFSDFKA